MTDRVRFTGNFDVDQMEVIDQYAEFLGRSRSEVLRRIVDQWTVFKHHQAEVIGVKRFPQIRGHFMSWEEALERVDTMPSIAELPTRAACLKRAADRKFRRDVNLHRHPSKAGKFESDDLTFDEFRRQFQILED